jgi:hypothetical protein
MFFFNYFSYRLHLLLHLLDHLWSHQDPIRKSIPTQRCLTWSLVKKLKWCHLNHTLVTVIVCKIYQWQEVFPTFLLVHYIHTQHIFQNLVHSLYFSIYLKVIRCTEIQLRSQGLLETSPKLSSKHRPLIGYDPSWYTM